MGGAHCTGALRSCSVIGQLREFSEEAVSSIFEAKIAVMRALHASITHF
jgi:hypothetical protein